MGQKRKEEEEREGREEKGRIGSEVSSPLSLVVSNCCSILREVVQSHNRQSLFAQGYCYSGAFCHQALVRLVSASWGEDGCLD